MIAVPIQAKTPPCPLFPTSHFVRRSRTICLLLIPSGLLSILTSVIVEPFAPRKIQKCDAGIDSRVKRFRNELHFRDLRSLLHELVSRPPAQGPSFAINGGLNPSLRHWRRLPERNWNGKDAMGCSVFLRKSPLSCCDSWPRFRR